MGIDYIDASADADRVLRSVRMDGAEQPDPRAICRDLGVRLELVAPHVLRGGHAARYTGFGDRIIRRRGMPPWMDAWAIAHELGHRTLGARVIEDVESWCNAFAGALLVPASSLFVRWRRARSLASLFEAYPHIAPTCLSLRLGEARLADVVVVQGRTPRYVRTDRVIDSSAIDIGAEAARRGHASRAGVASAWKVADGTMRAAVILDAA